MLGQVGDDADGHSYVEFLSNEGIQTENIQKLRDVPTGQAFIFSLADGNNSIIINGGANMTYAPNDDTGHAFPDSWRETIAQSSLLLLQREVPRFVNIEAAKVAKANNVAVIFDLGGRDDPVTNETISLCDIISPNETELSRMLATLPK